MEPQADGAAGEVPGDVDGRVVAGAGRFDVVDGVGDAGDLAAPCADGGDAAMRLALVLDDCVRGELGEVGVSVGPRREVKVAVDEFPGVAYGLLPPSWRDGQVASTRLAAVSAIPVLVAEDDPAATVRTPLRLNSAEPDTRNAVPPTALSASTPPRPRTWPGP